MPLSPWDVASLNPVDAGLYVCGMIALPVLPQSLAEVVATLASLPPVPWFDRPAPVVLIPGVMLVLTGTIRIPYVDVTGGTRRLWGLAVLHGNPPDVLVGWTPVAAPVLLESTSQTLVAELEMLVCRPSG